MRQARKRIVGIRFNPLELAAVRDAASIAGVSIAECIRSLAVEGALQRIREQRETPTPPRRAARTLPPPFCVRNGRD